MSELDLFILALKGQAQFIHSRLPKSEQLTFAAEIDHILLQAQTSASFSNAVSVINNDNLLLKEKNVLMRMFKNPYPTQKLAYQTALDLCDSFKVRFVDGGAKFYVGLYENRDKLNLKKK